MDGGYLTLIRTAAVSAVATKLLSRPDSATLGVFGAGAQAEFHVRLIAAVRPIESVVIWARRRPAAAALVASLRCRPELRHVPKWTAAEAPEEAAACDIVVTATGATEPVLEGRWLTPGAYVNPIGTHMRNAREVDSESVARASVLAIETSDTLAEAGDLQMAQAEVGGVVNRVTTLGALLDPRRLQSPRDPEAITLFKSCGVAFEDLSVAALAFERALRDQALRRFDFSRIDSPHTA
jgi:ornithine cyclodeaminase